MKLYVHKKPAPGVLSRVIEQRDDEPAPPHPWVEMTRAEFEAWVAAEQSLQAPSSVPRRALLRALANHGILVEHLEAACQAIADPTERAKALIDLRESVNFERGNPLVLLFAPAFGFDTPKKIDTLFAEAAQEDK